MKAVMPKSTKRARDRKGPERPARGGAPDAAAKTASSSDGDAGASIRRVRDALLAWLRGR